MGRGLTETIEKACEEVINRIRKDHNTMPEYCPKAKEYIKEVSDKYGLNPNHIKKIMLK